MDNSKYDYGTLKESDFILPEQPQLFLSGNRNRNPLFYLGLTVEPESLTDKAKTPAAIPAGYINKFNAQELLATHEEMPSAEQVRKWYRHAAGTGFRYCPRLYKGISHSGRIDSPKLGLTNDFFNRMADLKDKLGTSLLCLPDTVTSENRDGLFRYLQGIGTERELSVEFNHDSWFSDKDRFMLLIEKLHQLKKGVIITDVPQKRHAVHMQLSGATAVIRFYGLGWNDTDLFRISQWKKAIHSWYLQGLERCFLFLHIRNKEGLDDFIEYVQEECKF